MKDKMLKLGWPLLIISGAVIIAVVVVLARPRAEKNKAHPLIPAVRVQTVQAHDVQVRLEAQGTVEPRVQAPLSAQVAGSVVRLAPGFAAGGTFKKGAPMLWIDDVDYKLAVTQARMQVAQAELALARERQEARIAEEEWHQVGKGKPDPLVLRQPQVRQAEAALDAARAALEMAEINWQRSVIRAPYDCRIRSKQADLGQMVARGTPVALIYATDYAEVRLPLTDNQLAMIEWPYGKDGQWDARKAPHVTVRADFAGVTHEWPARLVRIEGEVDPRTRMIYVVARIDKPFEPSENSRPPLTVGQFVTAHIQGKTLKNVMSIDEDAVHNKNTVYVIDNEQHLRIRTVHVRRIQDGMAIIDQGLQNGEQVCLTPLNTVVDGMTVKPSEGGATHE